MTRTGATRALASMLRLESLPGSMVRSMVALRSTHILLWLSLLLSLKVHWVTPPTMGCSVGVSEKGFVLTRVLVKPRGIRYG